MRPLTPADAASVLALTVACDEAAIGVADYTIEDVEDDFARSSRQAWGLDGSGGRLRSMCALERRPGETWLSAEVLACPDEPVETGACALAFVRERALEMAPAAAVHVLTYAAADRDRSWLSAAGGQVVRHYWRMSVTFTDAPAKPLLPHGVTLACPGDDVEALRALHHVIDTAFLDHYGFGATVFEEWLDRHSTAPGADRDLWWLVRVDGVPASGLVARDWPDTGWVQGVGTLRAFRGRGLARMLLQTAFAEFARRGQLTVSLGVDADNPTGAVALYESVGMRVQHEALRYELPPLAHSVSEDPSPAGSMMSDSKNV
ncbi:MAG TPA: GNAT family N-acetyltransferase [Mycobacteriales bacterium]|nr:GNAT family N-acetyltransferase [Mycobacteriales bacterium]